MTNEKLLQELRKEIKELRDEVQRSRQFAPQPYPVYVPQPYYPQPWPWNPAPCPNTWIYGTVTWQNPTTGNYGIQSDQTWPLVNNASSTVLKCFPNLATSEGEDEIDLGSAL